MEKINASADTKAETKNEIKKLIDQKVSEHKFEVQGSTKAIENLQPKLTLGSKEGKLNAIRQLGMLKDKVVFHKACVAALTDLKESI